VSPLAQHPPNLMRSQRPRQVPEMGHVSTKTDFQGQILEGYYFGSALLQEQVPEMGKIRQFLIGSLSHVGS